ncbi:hypothetical protein K457DRAFT_21444 [Linnemannia elongata AG-77]|uniref:5'-Nucleotidase C-terminal domain-containing protein n=1 Tax=Linnemannia elongata AG-77 TaxID=1314771 RepID=A0A197JS01_9FUNG|nr:hypothetical protein K457DRAFT_21444 [Linnemannia elongata AG-77]
MASDNSNLSGCSTRNCFMGNFFHDAMLRHARTVTGVATAGRAWLDFAFANTGAIRARIPKGDITVEKVAITSPFRNYIVYLWLPFLLRLQNLSMHTSGHIIKAKIQDRTKNWRQIVPVQTYSVITMDFAVIGGDNILV